MKIVEVIPHLNIKAGAESLFIDLCVELKKEFNTDVEVVFLFDGIYEEFKNRLDEVQIKYTSLGKKDGLDRKCAKKFKELINKINPDVLHTHLNSVLTYYLAFGAKKQNWKVYHTVHNVADKETTDFPNKFARKRLLKQHILTNVAISDKIKGTILNYYGTKYEVPVIYNGINLVKTKAEEKEYDFINVARFTHQKNHMYLLDELKILKETNPNVKVVLLGDGELLEPAKQKAKVLGLEDNVTFVGYTNEVYKYMSKSKAFVLPSLFEGNPITILEAMNSGLPIIASDVGGVSDVLVNERNGLLINPLNKNELANAMNKLLNNQEMCEKMANNNKNDVVKYSISNCSKGYMELFEGKLDE